MKERHFSPYEIKLLLHIYAIAEPVEECLILDKTLERFRCMGLIETITEPVNLRHRITPKGGALIDYWCSAPLPVCKWVME